GGRSPFKPHDWCSYLRSVHGFWRTHDWLGSYPYLYGMGEPGATRFRVVPQPAAGTHSGFPRNPVIVAGKPTAQKRVRRNGGQEDADAGVGLASRYYGEFGHHGHSRAKQELALINSARRHHKQIWTYTYDSASHSTPGFAATEPASDPRVFVDWAAFEGIT